MNSIERLREIVKNDQSASRDTLLVIGKQLIKQVAMLVCWIEFGLVYEEEEAKHIPLELLNGPEEPLKEWLMA